MDELALKELSSTWNAMTGEEQHSFLSMFANCRPDFDFPERLKEFEVPLDEAITRGLPQEALQILQGSHGPIVGDFAEFGFSRTLPRDRLFVVHHPVLGWMVVTRNPNLNEDSPVPWHEPMPEHFWAFACLRLLWGQNSDATDPVEVFSDIMASVFEEMINSFDP